MGKSFRHTSQLNEKKEFLIPHGFPDQVALFSYDGSWIFGKRNDWFITERAIVWPKKEIYIHFHDIEKISSSFGSLRITDIEGNKTILPSRFINARSLSKFLNSAVSMTPIHEKEMKASLLSILKETIQLFLGGTIITMLIGAIFPPAAPVIAVIIFIVILLNPFMDKNEQYESRLES